MLEGFGSILDDEEIITGNLVRERIEEWLKENCEIRGNYKIFQKNSTYYVDVNGDVVITNKDIERFSTELFRFNKVKGDFNCSYCDNLKSLEGCPKIVGGFECDGCSSLTTLEGAPIIVEYYFSCYNCERLESLKGAPKKVNGNFYCSGCTSLSSLKNCPKIIKGSFYCSNCINIKSLEGVPREIKGDFYCDKCSSLKSLEGIPDIISHSLSCTGCNNLVSLKVLPSKIGSIFIKNCYKLKINYPDIEKYVRKHSTVERTIYI